MNNLLSLILKFVSVLYKLFSIFFILKFNSVFVLRVSCNEFSFSFIILSKLFVLFVNIFNLFCKSYTVFCKLSRSFSIWIFLFFKSLNSSNIFSSSKLLSCKFLLLSNCSLLAESNSFDIFSLASFNCFNFVLSSLFCSFNLLLIFFKLSICEVNPRRSELKLDICTSCTSLYFDIVSFNINNSFWTDKFSFSNFFFSDEIIIISLFNFFICSFNLFIPSLLIFFSFVIFALFVLLIDSIWFFKISFSFCNKAIWLSNFFISSSLHRWVWKYSIDCNLWFSSFKKSICACNLSLISFKFSALYLIFSSSLLSSPINLFICKEFISLSLLLTLFLKVWILVSCSLICFFKFRISFLNFSASLSANFKSFIQLSLFKL